MCGAQRSFTIHVVNNMNQEVLVITREFKCCAGCCCWCAGCCNCCAHEVQVSTPSGEVLGYIKQKGSCWKPNFHIQDSNRVSKYEIVGPCCICHGALCCCCENEFNVTSVKNGTECGKINREYSGFAKECYTKADNFSISFPAEIDVKTKACFLGALFLIDFMYFEDGDNKKK